MARRYQSAHVTVAPFTDRERCEPAPNSIVESLACGRPVVVTSQVGLANVIQDEGAGLICEPTGDALAMCLRQIRHDWREHSVAARALAEKSFGAAGFISAYERIYRQLL